MTAEHDDDLASALLDGLLTGDEEAAARQDPAVTRRVEQMAAARAALRAVPPLQPQRAEAGLSAALAAFDAGGSGPAPGDPPPPPGPTHAPAPEPPPSLAGARARRSRRPGRDRGRQLAAAAVLVLLVGVGGVLVTSQRAGEDAGQDQAAVETPTDRSTDTAAGRGDRSEDDGGNEDTGEDPGAGDAPEDGDSGAAEPDVGTNEAPDRNAASPPAPSDDAGGPVVDLGAVESPDELVVLAQEALADRGATDPPSNGTTGSGGDGRCPVPAEAQSPDAGAPRLAGRATLAGEPVDVWAVETGATVRVVAVDTGCDVVVDRSA